MDTALSPTPLTSWTASLRAIQEDQARYEARRAQRQAAARLPHPWRVHEPRPTARNPYPFSDDDGFCPTPVPDGWKEVGD